QRIPKPDEPEADNQRHPNKTNFHIVLLNVRIPISLPKQPHRPAQHTASALRHAKSGQSRLLARAAKIRHATTRRAREPCPRLPRIAAQPRCPALQSVPLFPSPFSIAATAKPAASESQPAPRKAASLQ